MPNDRTSRFLLFLVASAMLFVAGGCPWSPASSTGGRPDERQPTATGALALVQAVASPELVAAAQAGGGGDVPSNPLRNDATPSGEARPQAGDGDGEVRLGKNRDPFDPIKENGNYFVGWPKPTLAIVLTGRQDGYLEPCGCAGKERMKGGLMRRAAMFKELRTDRGWPTVGLDVGGLIKGFGHQAVMKFTTTVEALRQMKYDAMALGTNDLKLPAAPLFAVVANTEALPSPFLSANVGVFGFDHGMSAQERLIEAGGLRVGVTSVLGKKAQAEINNSDVEIIEPEKALNAIVPGLREKCDLMILLAHATMEESEALAQKFPDFDVVVTGGGPPEPPDRPATVKGANTLLVEVGTKGMTAVVLGIYGDKKPAGGWTDKIRYQRVIIDSRYPDSSAVKMLFTAYQDQLRQVGLASLGIRPEPRPATKELGRYVGSEKCESCHEPSMKVWRKSGHSDAWETLVNLDPPRNFDPECIACHVVGWNPRYYFPYEDGFLSEEKTPKLVDVGCEACHGPGEAHVAAEMGNNQELQEKFRKAAVQTLEDAKDHACATCHDLDNSPDFNFDTYWPLIEHREDY